MKGLKIGGFLAGAALVGIGVAMAVTNPDAETYDTYALRELSNYLETNFCPDAPKVLGNDLKEECISLIKENQSELKEFISDSTDRQNLLFFSIYRTRLSASELLPPGVQGFIPARMLPTYEFESVGLFQQFFTYKAKKQ